MFIITKQLKQLILTLAFLSLLAASFGCHTAHGFGKDVERAGEKIQDKTQ